MRPYRSVLHSESSEYGTYRVIDTVHDGRPARLLYGADDSLQSGVALDDDPELLFDYNQRFLEILMSHEAHKILVIGGGTCTLPTAAFRLFPKLTIDVVEIDGLLIDLAYRFFELPRSPRLRVHVDDAVGYLEETDERYDIIIIDAFFGHTVPPALLQSSSVREYRRHLTDSGIVAINFISEYRQHQSSLAHEIIASFSEVFPHTAVFQSDPDYTHGEEQNFILAASGGKIHFDYLQSTGVGPAEALASRPSWSSQELL